MSGSIITQEAVTPKIIDEYLFSTKTTLRPDQKAMFLRIATEFNLNPFRREIYAIAYGNDLNIVTGYQVYLARADATGNLDGWDVQSDGDIATITIYRKDFSKPFRWQVKRSDFDKGNGNWRKMPDFMLKKVAIGQGFRLAFPNELGGMPYFKEELEESEERSERKSGEPQTPPQSVQSHANENTPADSAKVRTNEIWNTLAQFDKDGLITRERMWEIVIQNFPNVKEWKELHLDKLEKLLVLVEEAIDNDVNSNLNSDSY